MDNSVATMLEYGRPGKIENFQVSHSKSFSKSSLERSELQNIFIAENKNFEMPMYGWELGVWIIFNCNSSIAQNWN